MRIFFLVLICFISFGCEDKAKNSLYHVGDEVTIKLTGAKGQVLFVDPISGVYDVRYFDENKTINTISVHEFELEKR